MKRVKRFTTAHVAQIKKDADKIYAMEEKIKALTLKIRAIKEEYNWTCYTDGTVTENLTSEQNMNVSEYLEYIKYAGK